MGKIFLQDLFAPNSICFGCGPKNEKGLRIKSYTEGDLIKCDWNASPHHEAFPGMLNGGILGAVLDCHCNWTAAYHIMKNLGLTKPLCTVTAEYSIKLKKPTPTTSDILMTAKIIELSDRKAIVEAELMANGTLCATCRGTFVAVSEGHPAFHRWN
ncbi:MAG: PaaI family thioesterase [Bacteriovoracales bacterium]